MFRPALHQRHRLLNSAKNIPAVRAFATNIWGNVPVAPADPILKTSTMFLADTDPKKVNLGIGAYRCDDGKPWVLPSVEEAERQMLADLRTINKEYLGVDGLASLKDSTRHLILGNSAPADRVASVQTLSGTGACRIAGDFLAVHNGVKKIYISDPTWGNHNAIFAKCGMTVETYPYWNADTKSIRIDEWVSHLEKADDGSCYLIHPCAHNPTGMDPTYEEWTRIKDICVKKNHICILDSAYQGYATGCLETDRKVIEMFVESGLELMISQSFAKNLGLYGERIGMLHVVTSNSAAAEAVLSQLKTIIRPNYSSPPLHGAHLVSKILNDEALNTQWKSELKMMADRILLVRKQLKDGLVAKGTPGNWDHVTTQIGMFSFTGLNPEQCDRLIKEFHIYLLKSGRISLAGLNSKNIDYVVDSIDKVVRG